MKLGAKESLLGSWLVFTGITACVSVPAALVVAGCVLATMSWLSIKEREQHSLEHRIELLELGLTAKADAHSDQLKQLVDSFVALRSDEAIRRGQGGVPRLRG